MVNKHRISIKSNRTRCSAISGARSSNAGTGLKVLPKNIYGQLRWPYIYFGPTPSRSPGWSLGLDSSPILGASPGTSPSLCTISGLDNFSPRIACDKIARVTSISMDII